MLARGRPLAGLLRPEPAKVGGVGGVAEQPLGPLEVRRGGRGVAVVEQDLGAGKVSAAELTGVLGRLEQPDRAMDLPQRRSWLALH